MAPFDYEAVSAPCQQRLYLAYRADVYLAEAQLAKIPYAVVIGDKEVQGRTLAPRRRGGENLPPLSLVEFMERLRGEVAQERGQA